MVAATPAPCTCSASTHAARAAAAAAAVAAAAAPAARQLQSLQALQQLRGHASSCAHRCACTLSHLSPGLLGNTRHSTTCSAPNSAPTWQHSGGTHRGVSVRAPGSVALPALHLRLTAFGAQMNASGTAAPVEQASAGGTAIQRQIRLVCALCWRNACACMSTHRKPSTARHSPRWQSRMAGRGMLSCGCAAPRRAH